MCSGMDPDSSVLGRKSRKQAQQYFRLHKEVCLDLIFTCKYQLKITTGKWVLVHGINNIHPSNNISGTLRGTGIFTSFFFAENILVIGSSLSVGQIVYITFFLMLCH